MNQEQDRIMKVTDGNGKEVEMYILFTTKLPDYDKNYIFYYDPKDPDGQVYVSYFDENSKLYPVENDEEWAQLEEVFSSFAEEMSNNKCENCNGDCEDCEEECE